MESVAELNRVLADEVIALRPVHILGGGSNVIVPLELDGLVVHMGIMGRNIVLETESEVVVEFGAGEVWHNAVEWCMARGLGGLENLALIPGTVGAAPIQNIGAYGVEQNSSFVQLTAVDIGTREHRTFARNECKFEYRNSVFKQELRGHFAITAVQYRLQKNPVVHVAYNDLAIQIEQANIAEPSIRDVFNAVVSVRTRKLPDPSIIGNCGSFFKNPVVSEEKFAELLRGFPDLPQYPSATGVKIPAAYLIDLCGWKGYDNGAVGIHKNHALVIIRTGDATSEDVVALASQIQQSVVEKFGVELEREVNVW